MSNFSIYGDFEDEVYGLNNDGNEYYCAPPIPSESGCYLPEFVYNSEYNTENFQVSCPVVSVQHGGTTFFYYPHVVYIPVYYYVPTYFVYETPMRYDEPCAIEDSLNGSKVMRYNYAYTDPPAEYGSFNSGSVEEIVSGEITSFYIIYTEYPENSDESGNEDEEKILTSDKKLEEDKDPNGLGVSENLIVKQLDKEVHSEDINLCDEDIDENVIKEIYLLNIDDIKENDENYEDGKAFLYQQALKGFVEHKNQLEELGWECYTLEDILEEKEQESDSTEMDFDENIVEDLKNINLIPDEAEACSSASVSLRGEESKVTLSEEALDKDNETVVVEAQPSVDPPMFQEKNRTDPLLELPSSKENVHTESLNYFEGQGSPVDSSAVGGNDKSGPFVELSLSKEKLCSGLLNNIEKQSLPVDSSATVENPKMDSVQQHSLKEEAPDSGSRSGNEEFDANISSQRRIDDGSFQSTPVILEPAASKAVKRKKRFAGLRKFFARMCCCVKKKS